LDEISQGPKRDFQPPSARWLVLVAAAGVVAAITAVVVLGGGRHVALLPKGVASRAVAARSSTAAPGTVVFLACDPAAQSPLRGNWRAGSLRVGPLWFVGARQQGYVQGGGWQGAGSPARRSGKLRLGEMIVAVMPGSMVVMKPAAAARAYFRFVDGFGPGVGYRLPTGDTGFTFAGCPGGTGGSDGQVSDFDLGFSMEAGRAAAVEVWPSPRSRPIRVIFTCPGHGSQGC
jgi:hypothetical protein